MTKKSSASSRHASPRRVKNGAITLTESMKDELKLLKKRKIDLSDPDAPEITHWDATTTGQFYRPIKKQITIRLDADVLDWFQKQPAGKYQTLINLACRDFMQRQQRGSGDK